MGLYDSVKHLDFDKYNELRLLSSGTESSPCTSSDVSLCYEILDMMRDGKVFIHSFEFLNNDSKSERVKCKVFANVPPRQLEEITKKIDSLDMRMPMEAVSVYNCAAVDGVESYTYCGSVNKFRPANITSSVSFGLDPFHSCLQVPGGDLLRTVLNYYWNEAKLQGLRVSKYK